MTKRRTITRDELQRLSICNSRKLPRIVNDEGTRYEWVGIGWINKGKATGREIKVVDSNSE